MKCQRKVKCPSWCIMLAKGTLEDVLISTCCLRLYLKAIHTHTICSPSCWGSSCKWGCFSPPLPRAEVHHSTINLHAALTPNTQCYPAAASCNSLQVPHSLLLHQQDRPSTTSGSGSSSTLGGRRARTKFSSHP